MGTESIQLTLRASLLDLEGRESLPEGYELREAGLKDLVALAHLYKAAYPPDIVASQQDALKEMDATFNGEYGELELAACPVITSNDSIAAAALTVKEAPWSDTPPGPFLIEVIVHPAHQRRGLGRICILEIAAILVSMGHETVALRVMSDNHAAMRLYESLGFTAWKGGAD